MSGNSERNMLPRSLIPQTYRVHIVPDCDSESFSAHVEIDLHVAQQTNTVKLNSALIEIQTACLKQEASDAFVDIADSSIIFDAGDETVQFTLDYDLSEGQNITLKLNYTGLLKFNLEGFYQSKYKHDDEERRVISTHLEPTRARQLLPCIDEPHARAEFVVSMVVKSAWKCASNMPVAREESLPKDMKLVTFEKTPSMPTYLLALFAGDMDYVEANTATVKFGVYSPYDKKQHATKLLDLIKRTLNYFEAEFQISYPLTKLDWVVVPGFSMGAMENWGMITSRTQMMYVEPGAIPWSVAKGSILIVMHELSHMWFGNLVTLTYWDCLWLKESCATLFATIGMTKHFPDLQETESELIDCTQSAFELDALRSTKPVERLVRDTKDADSAFDAICYDKGAAVLNMLLNHLGLETFMKGIRIYLKRHSYGHTVSEDLWNALGDVSGEPDLADRMLIWTRKPGFPVVKVTDIFLSGSDTELESLHLKQERFFSDGSQATGDDDHVYPLWIALRTKDGIQTVDMSTRELVVPIKGQQLVKVNAEAGGFYRVSYSPTHLEKLIAAGELHPIDPNNFLSERDRIGLVADMGALTSAGLHKTSELLELFLRWRHSDNYFVLRIIANHLENTISTFKFQSEETYNALIKLSCDIWGQKVKQLGWEMPPTDTFVEESLKAMVFLEAGKAGDLTVIAAAKSLFDARLKANDASAIPSTISREVCTIVCLNATPSEIEALVELAFDLDDNFAWDSLARSNDKNTTKRMLDFVLSGRVKSCDFTEFVRFMGTTPTNALAFWEWVKEHWQTVSSSWTHYLKRSLLECVFWGLSTAEQEAEIRVFIETNPMPEMKDELDQMLERFAIRRRWAERDANDLDTWLRSKGYLSS